MSEEQQKHETSTEAENATEAIDESILESENTLRAELRTLEEWCQALLMQNDELTFNMQQMREQSEKTLTVERQAYKEEIQALERVVKSSSAYINSEMFDIQKKHDQEMKTLRKENEVLKQEQMQQEQKKGGRRRSSFVETLFSSRLKKKQAVKEDENGDMDMLLRSVRTAEIDASNLKSHLKPLAVQINNLKKKIDSYVQQLDRYRECFNWLLPEHKEKADTRTSESGSSFDRQVVNKASELKHIFAGLNLAEIATRCFKDKELLTNYINILHTRLDVQKQANEQLLDELSTLHFKISCQSVDRSRRSLDSTFEESHPNVFLPFRPERPTLEVQVLSEEDDCSDAECKYCRNKTNVDKRKSSGSMLNLMIDDTSCSDSSKTFAPKHVTSVSMEHELMEKHVEILPHLEKMQQNFNEILKGQEDIRNELKNLKQENSNFREDYPFKPEEIQFLSQNLPSDVQELQKLCAIVAKATVMQIKEMIKDDIKSKKLQNNEENGSLCEDKNAVEEE